MRVKYVSEQEYPKLHQMVTELAQKAGLPNTPKIGISQLPIPNAFAFGRTKKGSRVCVTKGLLELLNEDELKAVLGHELSHIKHLLHHQSSGDVWVTNQRILCGSGEC